MKLEVLTPVLLSSLTIIGCSKDKEDKPNVILVMADDMGYECLSCYGSLSYKTPVLDSLASHGMLFGQCHSQPLSTPSRVKLMTGLYNYRNYDYFGHLNNDQYTFGSVMKEAGYSTCIAGKWQLNGLANKDSIPYWNDNTRAKKFGFDEYCLWQYTRTRNEGERYSLPLIDRNGDILKTTEDDYGPDMFLDFILDFIERKKNGPFFVYYPMVLVHDPFVPTPDSKDWQNRDGRYREDTGYFKDMVEYADKIVGKIATRLKDTGLDDNTILIFTGDNGTNRSVFTKTTKGIIKGDKGNTTDAGTHVPLIVYWPEKIKKGTEYNGLIEFSDFFPTLAELAGKEVNCDGRSFYPLLTGQYYEPRKTLSVHYNPRWSKDVNQFRNQFVRTIDYKLYIDGRFFDLSKDLQEQNPITTDSLSEKENEAFLFLKNELDKHPVWVSN